MKAPALSIVSGSAWALLLAALLFITGSPVVHGLTRAQQTFWVAHSDGISLIDPELRYGGRADTSLASEDGANELKPQTKDSLCGGEDCVWGEPQYIENGGLVAIANTKGDRVAVFDMTESTGRLVANVPTCRAPTQLLPMPWHNSIYVSCRGGSVDTISIKNWDLASPLANVLRDHTHDSQDHVYGHLVASEGLPDFAYSSNGVDAGYHKIHLNTKESEFINLAPHGCMEASDLSLSSWNLHGFIKCKGEDTFHLEINLKTDEVIQRIGTSGTAINVPGTNRTILVDNQQNVTRILEASEDGQPSQLDEHPLEGIGAFSQHAFVQGTASFGYRGPQIDVNVAVLASQTQFKVLLVNLGTEGYDTKLIELSPLHNMTNLPDGQAREVAATLFDEGVAFALAAPELNSTFLVNTMWDDDDVNSYYNMSLWETRTAQVQGIQGSAQSIMYLPDVETTSLRPLDPAYVRQSASSVALERLEDEVEELQENLWGADLSGSFWAFASDGVRAVDPTSGNTLAHLGNSSTLCSGACSWGYPVTDGQTFVAIPKRSEDRMVAFDIHSGRVLADVETCQSPYRIGLAAWRNEMFVHCWSRPEDESVHDQDGLVDVIKIGDWAVQHPLIDAISSPRPPIHGNIFTSPAFHDRAWSTNFVDHGLHKIDLTTKQSTFIDLSEHNCNNASSLAVSARNMHGFLSCNYGTVVLELDLSSDEVVTALNITGTPFATEDGMYIVIVPEQASNRLYIYQARQQGTASKLVAEITGDIQSFDRVAFAEKDGAHVAVVTSLTENKVMIIDMGDFSNTRVLAFRDSAAHGGTSAAADGHPARRAVVAGTLEDGRMVALVSAQRSNKLHIIDMGTGVLPPLETASVVHSVNGVDASLPKVLFVPKAQRRLHHAPAKGEVASVGLLDQVRDEGKQVQQQVVRLEDFFTSAAEITAESGIGGVQQSLDALLTSLNVTLDEKRQLQQQMLRLEDFFTSAAEIAAESGSEGVQQSLDALLTSLNVSLVERRQLQHQVVRLEDFFTSAAEIASDADPQVMAAAAGSEGVEQSMTTLLSSLNSSLAAMSEASAERQQTAQRVTTVEEYVAELFAAVTEASQIITDLTSSNESDSAPPAAAAAGTHRSLAQASSVNLDLGQLQNLRDSVRNLLSDLRSDTKKDQEANEVRQEVLQRLGSAESQLRKALQQTDDQSAQLQALRNQTNRYDSSASDTAIAAIVISCVGFVGMLAVATVTIAGAVRAEQAHRKLNHTNASPPSESDRGSHSNPGSHDELINPLSHVRGRGDNRV